MAEYDSSRQAGIQITEEMIRAGVEALIDSPYVDRMPHHLAREEADRMLRAILIACLGDGFHFVNECVAVGE